MLLQSEILKCAVLTILGVGKPASLHAMTEMEALKLAELKNGELTQILHFELLELKAGHVKMTPSYPSRYVVAMELELSMRNVELSVAESTVTHERMPLLVSKGYMAKRAVRPGDCTEVRGVSVVL